MNTFQKTNRAKINAFAKVQSQTRYAVQTDLPAYLKAFFVLRDSPNTPAQTAPTMFVQP